MDADAVPEVAGLSFAPMADASTQVSVTRMTAAQPTQDVVGQIFALLERAETTAAAQSPELRPAIGQAAAELESLLTAFLAQNDDVATEVAGTDAGAVILEALGLAPASEPAEPTEPTESVEAPEGAPATTPEAGDGGPGTEAPTGPAQSTDPAAEERLDTPTATDLPAPAADAAPEPATDWVHPSIDPFAVIVGDEGVPTPPSQDGSLGDLPVCPPERTEDTAAGAPADCVPADLLTVVTFEDVLQAAMTLTELLDAVASAVSVLGPDGLPVMAGADSSLAATLHDVVRRYGETTSAYANGRIPAGVLCSVPFAPAHRLRCDAASQLAALNAAFEARFGKPIPITDTYRTFEAQVALKIAKPFLAATPGYSVHGWGLAVDLGAPVSSGRSAEYVWLRLNGPDYGWDNPRWARLDGSKPEPWHFEFFAAAPIPFRALSDEDVTYYEQAVAAAKAAAPDVVEPQLPSTATPTDDVAKAVGTPAPATPPQAAAQPTAPAEPSPQIPPDAEPSAGPTATPEPSTPAEPDVPVEPAPTVSAEPPDDPDPVAPQEPEPPQEPSELEPPSAPETPAPPDDPEGESAGGTEDPDRQLLPSPSSSTEPAVPAASGRRVRRSRHAG